MPTEELSNIDISVIDKDDIGTTKDDAQYFYQVLGHSNTIIAEFTYKGQAFMISLNGNQRMYLNGEWIYDDPDLYLANKTEMEFEYSCWLLLHLATESRDLSIPIDDTPYMSIEEVLKSVKDIVGKLCIVDDQEVDSGIFDMLLKAWINNHNMVQKHKVYIDAPRGSFRLQPQEVLDYEHRLQGSPQQSLYTFYCNVIKEAFNTKYGSKIGLYPTNGTMLNSNGETLTAIMQVTVRDLLKIGKQKYGSLAALTRVMLTYVHQRKKVGTSNIDTDLIWNDNEFDTLLHLVVTKLLEDEQLEIWGKIETFK